MASRLLAPSLLRQGRAALGTQGRLVLPCFSTTVQASGGPPGSGFTASIITPLPTTVPDSRHTLPPPSLASMREPLPPARVYTAAGAAAAGEVGGTATHTGSGGHHQQHHQHMEMGATVEREDREEVHMEKEEQRKTKKEAAHKHGQPQGKSAAAAAGQQQEQHQGEGGEDPDMNERARDEAAKRTQDYST